MLSRLDLDPKCHVHSRYQKLMTWGTKNMPSPQKIEQGSFSNCDADANADVDADADTDSSKTICRGGGLT